MADKQYSYEPCPFCGKESTAYVTQDDGSLRYQCLFCGCSAPDIECWETRTTERFLEKRLGAAERRIIELEQAIEKTLADLIRGY